MYNPARRSNRLSLTMNTYIKDAESLEDEGRLTEALAAWEVAMASDTSSYSLSRYALAALELGMVEKAVSALTAACERSTTSSSSHSMLGSIYLDLGEPELAREWEERAIEVDPTPIAYTLLGVALAELGQKQPARWSYQQALALDPDYEEALYNLAVTYLPDDPTKAIELLAKAIEIDPEYAIAHRELGRSFLECQEPEQALEHLREAISLDPEDSWSHVYLGNAFWALGLPEEAEDSFFEAIKTDPEDVLAAWAIAFYYDQQGRSDEAEEFYRKALAIDPDHFVSNRDYGKFLLEKGDPENAEIYLKKAQELDDCEV
ncbi:MAG: tetratricopeptide repeat protein [Pyrinomonadaceae bacterium]